MNNHINDLEHEGWAKMNALLDQKMPVKKSKRLIWFWLWIPLVIGSGITYKYLPTSNVIPSNKNMEINQKNTNPISNKILATHPKENVTPSGHSNLNKNLLISNRIYSEHNNSKQTVRMSITDLSNDHNIARIIDPLLISNDNEQNLKHESLSFDSIASMQIQQFENRSEPVLNFLPIKSLTLTSSENNLLPSISTEIIPNIRPLSNTKSKTKIQLGIQMGLNAYTSIHQLSANTGLYLNVPFNRKHSMSVIPSFNVQKNNFLIFNCTNNEPLNYIINNFAQNELKVFEDAFKNSKQTSDSIHVIYKKYLFQFQIPIYYSYTFNRHWKGHIGTKLNISLNQLSQNRSNDFIQYNSNTIQRWRAQPIDYFLLIGADYYIDNSWGIGLDYSYGFQNTKAQQLAVPNTSSPSPNSSTFGFEYKKLDHLNVSLKYRF